MSANANIQVDIMVDPDADIVQERAIQNISLSLGTDADVVAEK